MSQAPASFLRGALHQSAARDALIARAAALQTPGPGPSDVPSPCVSVCQMDSATGWCAGCLRTLDEIAVWARLAEGPRRAVWQGLSARAQALNRHAVPPAPNRDHNPPEAP